MAPREIQLEGFSPDELLTLDDAALDALVFTGEAIVFRAGTAEILGEFRVNEAQLKVELGHIDGGGEGVLPMLWALAERYARRRGLAQVEWIVHAVNCPRPNPKLRRVLERRGFAVRELPGIGPAYHRVHPLEH